jgi:hypothetical protein
MSSPERYDFLDERDPEVLKRKIATDGLFESEVRSDDSATQLRNRLLLGMLAKKIASDLGKRCVIATARIRAGMKGNLLHPVATWPPALNSFFLDPEHYENFQFTPNAFGHSGGETIDCGIRDWCGRNYALQALNVQNQAIDCFTGRIDTFLSHIEAKPDRYGVRHEDLIELRKTGTCLVFGGINRNADFVPSRQDRGEEFYHFLALYLLPDPKNTSRKGASLSGTGTQLAKMFRALEISERNDKEDFERDGLALVSDLIPALTKSDMAPSDAIAYFLREMDHILKNHTLGIEDQHTWVRFIAIDTVIDEQNTYTPRFHVFPYHSAASSETASIGSFLMSHPKRRATVKLIVRQWAKLRNIRLSKDFEALFEGLPVDKVIYDPELKSACVSADDDRALWKKVNLDITSDDRTTRCTLAFIIETHVNGTVAPYATVIFESDIPDAFSRRDVERFRGLIDACSDLFLGLRLSNLSFDVKQQIRYAFSDTSTLTPIGNHDRGQPARTEIHFGMFCFELLRVNQTLLMKIIANSNERIWTGGGISQLNAEKYIAKQLRTMPGKEDEDAEDTPLSGNDAGRIVFDTILRDRTKWIIENEARLHKSWNESGIAGDIYEFLTNVPSNIVWHCYLSAIPRAIADRTGGAEEMLETDTARVPSAEVGDRSQPTFKVMRHGGRSALAMFVFSAGTQAFRQIIKLSDRQRVKDEAKNYRRFVRYNVPLSARLPLSGTAYEADGNPKGAKEKTGKIFRSPRSFGALVSDLIAGSRDEQRPVTFFARLIELIMLDPAHRDAEIEAFKAAIEYQFEHNIRRWKTWSEASGWVVGSVVDTVREVTRVHFDGQNSLKAINDRLKVKRRRAGNHDELLCQWLDNIFNTHRKSVLDNLKAIDARGANIDKMDAAQFGAIIHGDMNGRNLVWSKDYVKFFMLDFERVRMGFYGADQLRLVFSLLSDMVADAYQMEDFRANVSDEEITTHIRDVDKVMSDVNAAIPYIGEFMKTIGKAGPGEAADKVGSIAIPEPPNGSISAIAISAILNSMTYLKGQREFWTFAIAMTSAKQLEYAMREIDKSCKKTLERFRNTPINTHDSHFNLYNYFQISELKGRIHDKFVLGKIARALFAYHALASVMTDGEINER